MAETIGKVVLCYDVDNKHKQVKEELLKEGYLDYYFKPSTNTKQNMPETTVWHETKQVSIAIYDITKICYDLDVTLINAFASLSKDEVEGYNS